MESGREKKQRKKDNKNEESEESERERGGGREFIIRERECVCHRK